MAFATWLRGRGALKQEEQDRFIYANDAAANAESGFCDNFVITSRYTWYNFLPVFLFEQFARFANAYFLLVAVLQCIPSISITNGIPLTFLPLSIVLSFDGLVTAREDYKRHRDDKKANESKTLALRNGAFAAIAWQDVKVGDMLKVIRGEAVPADCVFLSSTSRDLDQPDTCYVQTAQLDGETNLKLRQAIPATVARLRSDADCASFDGFIRCEAPNPTFDKFVGTIVMSRRQGAAAAAAAAAASAHEAVVIATGGGGGGGRGSGKGRGNGAEDGIELVPTQLARGSSSGSNRGEVPFSDAPNVVLNPMAACGATAGPGSGVESKVGPSRSPVPSGTPPLSYAPLPASQQQAPDVSKPWPLESEQTLLRGSIIRNVDHVYALVVYTGRQTKVRVRQSTAVLKRAQVETEINRMIIVLIILLLAFCLTGGIAGSVWTARNSSTATYLMLSPHDAGEGVRSIFTYFLLNAGFIPVSLYVTVRLARSFQMLFMEMDLEMLHEDAEVVLRTKGEEGSFPFRVRAMDLNDELGQITQVFSDKTGTLTLNYMDFRKFLVNGVGYGLAATPIGVDRLRREGRDVGQLEERLAAEKARGRPPGSLPHVYYDDGSETHPGRTLLHDASSPADGAQGSAIHDFMLNMALNHTVLPEMVRNATTGKVEGMRLSASSPDEEAFLYAAETFGYKFVGRTRDSVTLQCRFAAAELPLPRAHTPPPFGALSTALPEGGGTAQPPPQGGAAFAPKSQVSFRILHILAYSQERKRMSVIVQHPVLHADGSASFPPSGGEVVLYCKGADSTIFARCRDSIDPHEAHALRVTRRTLAEWGNDGLRTLVFAQRKLRFSDFAAWSAAYEAATSDIDQIRLRKAKQPNRIDALMDEIEQGFVLQGATANEDKLQPDVPETIAQLSKAGIKVWMVTGDKQETAVNIGFATRLLDETMRQVVATKESAGGVGAAIRRIRIAAKRMRAERLRDEELRAARLSNMEATLQWFTKQLETLENRMGFSAPRADAVSHLAIDMAKLQQQQEQGRGPAAGAAAGLFFGGGAPALSQRQQSREALVPEPGGTLRFLSFRSGSRGGGGEKGQLRSSGSSSDGGGSGGVPSRDSRSATIDAAAAGAGSSHPRPASSSPSSAGAGAPGGTRGAAVTRAQHLTAGAASNSLPRPAQSWGGISASPDASPPRAVSPAVGAARDAASSSPAPSSRAPGELVALEPPGAGAPRERGLSFESEEGEDETLEELDVPPAADSAEGEGEAHGGGGLQASVEGAGSAQSSHLGGGGGDGNELPTTTEAAAGRGPRSLQHASRLAHPSVPHLTPAASAPSSAGGGVAAPPAQPSFPAVARAAAAALAAKKPQLLTATAPLYAVAVPAGGVSGGSPSPSHPHHTIDEHALLAHLTSPLLGPQRRPYALVIDEHVLDAALAHPRSRAYLLYVSVNCSAVIACRARPDQKARVVRLIREGVPSSRTLAIGDGANDVDMIRTAHVGVGIAGVEGVQAANASDYSIGRFRFLQRLLLVHGRWNYNRMSKLVLYSFYKNLVFVVTQFWFSQKTGFSGQKFYIEYGTQTFNLLYTSLPVLMLGIYDQDVDADWSLRYPKLYDHSRGSRGLNIRVFIAWMVGALVESLVIFNVSVRAYVEPDGNEGATPYVFQLGTLCFSCVLAVVTMRLAAEMNMHHPVFSFFTAASALIWIPACFVFDALNADGMRGGVARVFGSLDFWLVLGVVLGICGVRLLAWKALRRMLFPELRHLVQEVAAITHDESSIRNYCEASDLARRTGKTLEDVFEAQRIATAATQAIEAQQQRHRPLRKVSSFARLRWRSSSNATAGAPAPPAAPSAAAAAASSSHRKLSLQGVLQQATRALGGGDGGGGGNGAAALAPAPPSGTAGDGAAPAAPPLSRGGSAALSATSSQPLINPAVLERVLFTRPGKDADRVSEAYDPAADFDTEEGGLGGGAALFRPSGPVQPGAASASAALSGRGENPLSLASSSGGGAWGRDAAAAASATGIAFPRNDSAKSGATGSSGGASAQSALKRPPTAAARYSSSIFAEMQRSGLRLPMSATEAAGVRSRPHADSGAFADATAPSSPVEGPRRLLHLHSITNTLHNVAAATIMFRHQRRRDHRDSSEEHSVHSGAAAADVTSSAAAGGGGGADSPSIASRRSARLPLQRGSSWSGAPEDQNSPTRHEPVSPAASGEGGRRAAAMRSFELEDAQFTSRGLSDPLHPVSQRWRHLPVPLQVHPLGGAGTFGEAPQAATPQQPHARGHAPLGSSAPALPTGFGFDEDSRSAELVSSRYAYFGRENVALREREMAARAWSHRRHATAPLAPPAAASQAPPPGEGRHG